HSSYPHHFPTRRSSDLMSSGLFPPAFSRVGSAHGGGASRCGSCDGRRRAAGGRTHRMKLVHRALVAVLALLWSLPSESSAQIFLDRKSTRLNSSHGSIS